MTELRDPRAVMFDNALDVLKDEAWRQECVIRAWILWTGPERAFTPAMAQRCGTSPDNIRMARLRAVRFLEEHCGRWVGLYIEQLRDNQRAAERQKYAPEPLRIRYPASPRT